MENKTENWGKHGNLAGVDPLRFQEAKNYFWWSHVRTATPQKSPAVRRVSLSRVG